MNFEIRFLINNELEYKSFVCQASSSLSAIENFVRFIRLCFGSKCVVNQLVCKHII